MRDKVNSIAIKKLIMASPPKESPGGQQATILVRQVQTNEEYTGLLEVDPNLVDEDGTTRNVIFRYLQTAADTDETLTDEQASKIRFCPEGLDEQTTESTQASPVMKLVERLKVYAEDFEKHIKKDEVICKETDKIATDCIKTPEGVDQIDSGRGVTIDLKQVWSTIKEVFEELLSDIYSPDVTATTVFVRLGFGLAYTFYLLKRLVIKYLDEITFPGVVDIMCSIVSLLLKYLIQIKFKQILRKLGGWQSLLATAVVNTGTDIVLTTVAPYFPNWTVEYIAWGVCILAFGTAVYLRVKKS